MPVKYRRMADFHEYYSGTRKAPYLTIFIGGNHEASNYLFELYYGGWVAPNIYYLGAANIIRFGSLRIAGVSGIWKGYDYRKPHFERLPYNNSEMHSIFHVRELDVRKLLASKTQVDIGMSHDWPQGIEWLGDYERLFKKRTDFKEDAEAGRLGSVAARQCLDRLRPRYWFSAHLHSRYTASLEHGDYVPVKHVRTSQQKLGPASNKVDAVKSPKLAAYDLKGDRAEAKKEDSARVSAWQSFHVQAEKDDLTDRIKVLQEAVDRKKHPLPSESEGSSHYTFQETFKQVTTNDDLGRKVTSIIKDSETDKPGAPIPSLDGCGFSRTGSLKRRREPSEGSEGDHTNDRLNGLALSSSASGHTAEAHSNKQPPMSNPDAIDISMSSDEEPASNAKPVSLSTNRTNDTGENGSFSTRIDTQDERETTTRSGPNNGRGHTVPGRATEKHHLANDEDSNQEGLSPTALAELADISNSFLPKIPAKDEIPISASLPLPEGIDNTITDFLALGKCEKYQDSLQLMEIASTSTIPASDPNAADTPLKLSYDPEWLAIQRVFAPELDLGGNPPDLVSQHLGDTEYAARIVEEEKWIHENVTSQGLLQIPENFVVTAPVYEPKQRVGDEEMPSEYTNPETAAYCALIGIDNKLDFSDEDRQARKLAGPRFEAERGSDRGNRGGGGGRNRSNWQSGRGGRGGGQGGGRGRGRGRGSR